MNNTSELLLQHSPTNRASSQSNQCSTAPSLLVKPLHRAARLDSPNSSHSLNMTLQPPHNALGLKIQHRHDSIEPPNRKEMPGENSPRVEAGAESGRVDGGLKVLGEILRERIYREREEINAECCQDGRDLLSSSRFIEAQRDADAEEDATKEGVAELPCWWG
jgi:hypothetical protein